MQNQSDAQLLCEYAAHRSEAAFGEIVARHTGLIYSAALRQSGTPDAAREIAQSVFINLARKAPELASQLSPGASLAGWLYCDARFAALHWRRDECRREAHERLVMENFNPAADTAPDWGRVAPALDEAMAELNDTDREAVLLRFFQNQDFAAVGRALGVSDDAAQKRVSRAVERLREFLARRGVTVSTGGLAVVLSTNAVLMAPAGLSACITAAAVAGTTTIVTTTALATAAKTIAMTTLQKTLVATAFAAAIGTGIYEARQASMHRAQVAMLQQQQAALDEQIQQLTGERDSAARPTGEPVNERLNRAAAELLKLRAELSRLKMAGAPTPEGDPTQMGAKAWLTRVNLLKAYLNEHPEKRIPEMQFISERDWLSVTANDFETDENGVTAASYRHALSLLHDMGRMRFSQKAIPALKSYELTHDRQFPTDVSQMKPHFAEPMDDAVLQRYAIMPKFAFQGMRLTGDWVLAEISSPDETTYRYVMSGEGSEKVPVAPSSAQTLRELQAEKEAQIRPLLDQLLPLAKAYSEAHEGHPPLQPEQLSPYATTPEQQSALQKLIQIRKGASEQLTPDAAMLAHESALQKLTEIRKKEAAAAKRIQ